MALMVLMAEIASAPPCLAASATGIMSVMLGVILAMTGILHAFFTTSVKCETDS